MSETFLTIEGDRSGIETPSRKDKALNRFRANQIKHKILELGWDDLTADQLQIGLDRLIDDLKMIKLMVGK